MALQLSPKYNDFLRHSATVEFMEGTTYAGKTTVGIKKFIARVAQSTKKLHVISGLNLAAIERNIINKELGILDLFGEQTQYHASKKGPHSGPHITFQPSDEADEKIIYVLGYDTQTRWKKILGGQYGCVYIDEINVADMDYVRELSIRCDYLLATLNPDDPDLPVYKEYINHARPVAAWANETPDELLAQLNAPEKDGWTHWYFSFDHNAGLDTAKKKQIIDSVPKDTKLYKNKILGLRGRATGLIFNLEPRHLISAAAAKKDYQYLLFSCGVDTSYSSKSDDTFAFVFSGFTKCRRKITLAVKTYNNRDLVTPLSPSDIPPLLVRFLRRCEADWGGIARDVYIDSADQATILECNKYKRSQGLVYNFVPSYKQLKIIDRIHLQAGWMARGHYFIMQECAALIDEMNVYRWQTDRNEPENRNDHVINADQYSWIPYKEKIG